MADLTIIDGHNYLFRAFYGVPAAARTKEGVQVNAVYGFFAFIRRIVSAYPDNDVFVAFDSETGTRDKVAEMKEYKDNRTIDAGMFEQLPLIKNILDLMNIKWVEHPKYEADDVIASMAVTWLGKAYISSNDFDFAQLVSDKIFLLRSAQGGLVNCDDAFIKSKFGVAARQYADYLSITGDKTDNIAGAPGIGKKTAAALLNKYGDIPGIFDAAGKLPQGVRDKLVAGRERIEANRIFIAMNTGIPRDEIFSGVLPPVRKDAVLQKIAAHLEKIGIR
ncbi:MAG: hypothetical protein LBK26_03015 [Rickettsiales bacterium]|jgi:DNA polymerase-1|nr:hypothetical protein [Rickettsiales bacterium]